MMDNVHAERKAASYCSSPNSQHCSQFSKQKVLKFSQIERKSQFQRPIKTRNMQPAAIIHPCRPQYRDSQKSQEVDYTPDEMFRRTDLCAWNFLFFHLAMTFLAGYPFWDMVTQSLWAWDVRTSHSGAKGGGMSKISGIDYTGGDIVSASIV
jgi:hypothetical protein